MKRFSRLSQALVHFVSDLASLFTDHRISGLPIRAKYKYFRTIWEHTFDISPTDFKSFSLKWWSSMHGVDTLWSCWVACLLTHNILPHISWHDLPCHRTTKRFSDFPSMVIFSVAPAEILDSNMALYLSTISLLLSHFLWVHPRKHDQRKMLVLPNRLLSQVFSTLGQCFVSFQPIWCHPHTQIRITLFSRCTNKHSQLGTFSQPYFNRIFSNCLSHNSPVKRRQEGGRGQGCTCKPPQSACDPSKRRIRKRPSSFPVVSGHVQDPPTSSCPPQTEDTRHGLAWAPAAVKNWPLHRQPNHRGGLTPVASAETLGAVAAHGSLRSRGSAAGLVDGGGGLIAVAVALPICWRRACVASSSVRIPRRSKRTELGAPPRAVSSQVGERGALRHSPLSRPCGRLVRGYCQALSGHRDRTDQPWGFQSRHARSHGPSHSCRIAWSAPPSWHSAAQPKQVFPCLPRT